MLILKDQLATVTLSGKHFGERNLVAVTVKVLFWYGQIPLMLPNECVRTTTGYLFCRKPLSREK